MSPIDERKYYTCEQAPSEVYTHTQTPLTQTVNIQVWQEHPASDYYSEPPQLLPWQRIYRRLLN